MTCHTPPPPTPVTVPWTLPQGTKMTTWNLGPKMPNLVKITFFRKLRQVEVSASDVLLGIYFEEVLIFF